MSISSFEFGHDLFVSVLTSLNCDLDLFFSETLISKNLLQVLTSLSLLPLSLPSRTIFVNLFSFDLLLMLSLPSHEISSNILISTIENNSTFNLILVLPISTSLLQLKPSISQILSHNPLQLHLNSTSWIPLALILRSNFTISKVKDISKSLMKSCPILLPRKVAQPIAQSNSYMGGLSPSIEHISDSTVAHSHSETSYPVSNLLSSLSSSVPSSETPENCHDIVVLFLRLLSSSHETVVLGYVKPSSE